MLEVERQAFAERVAASDPFATQRRVAEHVDDAAQIRLTLQETACGAETRVAHLAPGEPTAPQRTQGHLKKRGGSL